MASIILNYNITLEEIAGIKGDYANFYEKEKRNSCFALVFKKDEHEIIAMRDHLGIVPLFYRFDKGEVNFSTNFSDLVKENDRISEKGLRCYLAHKTPTLYSLVEEVKIVPPGSAIRINLKEKTVTLLYQFFFKQQPRLSINLDEIIEKYDKLMLQAIKRVLKEETVGLYLSGGMDSGLLGIYLKKAGAKINAYTSAPWGMKGTEVSFAERNAQAIGVENHVIIPLDTSKYKEHLKTIPEVFRTINGLNNTIGVVNLWKDTEISKEKQIFGAQNADTMLCSMPHQYYVYFLSWLPVFLKKKIHPSFKHADALSDYIDYCTHGIEDQQPDHFNYSSKDFSKISYLTLAGMYIGHTPPDGAVLAVPAISKNIAYGNPFYDIDLIEWSMRVPLKYRLGLSGESKIKLGINKTVIRKLALKYLPKELVYRKKGFVIPMERDENTRRVVEMLPKSINNFKLRATDERIAAYILMNWCEKYGIKY